MNDILFTICEQIKNISILLNPIIPASTSKVLDIMNVKNENRLISHIDRLDCFDHDTELKKSNILFNKFENDN